PPPPAPLVRRRRQPPPEPSRLSRPRRGCPRPPPETLNRASPESRAPWIARPPGSRVPGSRVLQTPHPRVSHTRGWAGWVSGGVACSEFGDHVRDARAVEGDRGVAPAGQFAGGDGGA